MLEITITHAQPVRPIVYALYQIWPILYGLACAIIINNTIRSERDDRRRFN